MMLQQRMFTRIANVCSCRGAWPISSARVVCTAGRTTLDISRRVVGSDAASPQNSLEVMREKNRQLRSTLGSLRWPRLTHFQAFGQQYALPWRSRDKLCTADLSQPTQRQLAYLSGFFDGDGCVLSRALCGLSVSQSVDGAQNLMEFAAAFGGVIYRKSDGLGLAKPSLQWRLRGHAARCAAHLLRPQSIVKRQQLQMASEWPLQPADTYCLAKELRSLKQYDSAISSTPSWEYFTGFFDAEGCLVNRNLAGIELSICQKHVTVLQCLQRFLSREMGIDATIHKHSNRQLFTLRVSKASVCKQIIARMLECGLTRKADQAKLVLELTPSNSAEVRAAMAALAGNQQFGRRLDEAGRSRAAEIHKLRLRETRAKELGQQQTAAALLEELRRCKCEHALLKARNENAQLQDQIRKLLTLRGASAESDRADGAEVTSCERVAFPNNDRANTAKSLMQASLPPPAEQAGIVLNPPEPAPQAAWLSC